MPSILDRFVIDLLAAVPEQELVDTFDIDATVDLHDQLLETLGEAYASGYAGILECLESLGIARVKEVLRKHSISYPTGTPRKRLIQLWLEHHQVVVRRPKARPHETARTILEISTQLADSPEEVLLIRHIERLLRYIALFYAGDVLTKPQAQTWWANRGLQYDETYVAEILCGLSLEELCNFICLTETAAAEPYRSTSTAKVLLVDGEVRDILRRLAGLTTLGENDSRNSSSSMICSLARAILQKWNFGSDISIIPKGAIVIDVKSAEFDAPVSCFDEMSSTIVVNALRADARTGDNLLLSYAARGKFSAPRLRPLPEHDSWKMPGDLGQTPRAKEAAASHEAVNAAHALEVVSPDQGTPQRSRIDAANVFICYAHEDRIWKDKVIKCLSMLEHRKDVAVWCDDFIPHGSFFDSEIQSQLIRTQIAILLVSECFFSAEYITKVEYPLILRAEDCGLKILPLCISTSDKLKDFLPRQFVNDPERPLDTLSMTEEESVMSKLQASVSMVCTDLARSRL